jgi:hypothetical protein
MNATFILKNFRFFSICLLNYKETSIEAIPKMGNTLKKAGFLKLRIVWASLKTPIFLFYFYQITHSFKATNISNPGTPSTLTVPTVTGLIGTSSRV